MNNILMSVLAIILNLSKIILILQTKLYLPE